MDVDDLYGEEDDFYAPDEPTTAAADAKGGSADAAAAGGADADKGKAGGTDYELEEGEEEDEGADDDDDDDDADSDIDIITERKDGSKPAPPPSQTRYNDIRNIPQRTASGDASSSRPKAAPSARQEESKPSPAYPTAVPTADKAAAAASSSKLDINGNPMYKPAGKPIMQVNIDEDLPDHEKPWRKPGTDITDYFNYGFDEFTWALYASKQDNMRNEYNQDMIAANNKKMMDDLNLMMMGGMPGMAGPTPPTGPAAGVPSAAAGAQAAGPSMDGIPPEMQAMFQQMVASGIDPSQIDPASMAGMFGGGMQGQAAQGQGGYGQGFGGQGQYGGYDGGMGGGRGGRGRGGRRW